MKNNKYKLLVVDIDGTILDTNNRISDIDKQALKEVINSGTPVALSTGRVVQASLRLLNQLELDGYHMFFDGALVYSPENDEEVYVDSISADIIGEMIEYSQKIQLDFDLYSITHFFAERESRATEIRRDFFKLDATIVDFREIQHKERFIKGTLVVSTAEEKQKADNFVDHFNDRLNFSCTYCRVYSRWRQMLSPLAKFLSPSTH